MRPSCRRTRRGFVTRPKKKRAWVVAIGGVDPTGSAGIVADARTIEAMGAQPAVVVTAITVQTGSYVREVVPVPAGRVRAQLAAVFDSLPVAAVKCGLLPRPAIVREVARELVGRRRCAVVVDPVAVASAGARLASVGARKALIGELLPIADVLSVNLAEAAELAGMPVTDREAMERAACRIARLGPRAVVVKGGHLGGPPADLLWRRGRTVWFSGRRIAGRDMHGSGCAFASGVAAALACGQPLEQAVRSAGRHVRRLIAAAEPSREGAWLRAKG